MGGIIKLKNSVGMKCFTQGEASEHILAIQNAFKNNFKSTYNALMSDMSTSNTVTMTEAYKYKLHKWFTNK